MNRTSMSFATIAVIALSLTACVPDDSDDTADEQPSTAQETTSEASSGADNGPAEDAPEGEAPGDGTWVVVTNNHGEAEHTIKQTDGTVDVAAEFEKLREIEIDGSVESVYVEGMEESDVTCTIWVDGEAVAHDEAANEPARCWPSASTSD